jgi:hypothetical protein
MTTPEGGVTPPETTPVRWHRLEIETTSPDGDSVTRRAEGDDQWIAASLRALADQLAPPQPVPPVTRPGRGPILRERVVPGSVAPLPPPSDVPRRDPMSLG